VACNTLDEQTCGQTPGCVADYCERCSTQEPVFSGCRSVEAKPIGCTDPDLCPTCESLDEATCGATPGCHQVLESGFCAAACDDEGPCCSFFLRCARGATADCNPDHGICDSRPPYCEPPLVVAYSDTACYEGCVYPDVCR
jgi:hypothetical protein